MSCSTQLHTPVLEMWMIWKWYIRCLACSRGQERREKRKIIYKMYKKQYKVTVEVRKTSGPFCIRPTRTWPKPPRRELSNTYQKRNHILDIVLNESSSVASRPFCLTARHSRSLHSDITELNSTTWTVSWQFNLLYCNITSTYWLKCSFICNT